MQFRKLYIKNFQSIKEMEINFEANTCYHIKGRNNIGKSSLLKVITALVKNVSSRNLSSYIRDDEESFYVESTDFDNNVVRLSRGKEDYYSWIIDGQEGRIDSTAGKVPDVVKDYFNMYEEAEKTKEIINIRPPRAKLLFVDTTYGENYFLLQKALRVEEYLSAIKLGGSKRSALKKEVDVLVSRVSTEEEELSNLKDYSLTLKEIKMYEEVADNFFNQIKEIHEIQKMNEEITLKEDRIKEATFDYDSEAVGELVNKIKLIQEVCKLNTEILNKQKGIEVKELTLAEFESADSIYKELKDSLENKKLIDTVSSLSNKIKTTEEKVAVKENIISNWEIEKVGEKVGFIKSAIYIVSQGTILREKISKLKDIQLQCDIAEKEKADFMLEYKFCPVVLSMKDKKCPFSNKTLEELLV